MNEEDREKSRPLTLRDSIAQRPDWVNEVDQLRDRKRYQRTQQRKGQTISVSFTFTMQLDAKLHDLSIYLNKSRSEVVRQAVIEYILKHENETDGEE
jgi:hypothetical protein